MGSTQYHYRILTAHNLQSSNTVAWRILNIFTMKIINVWKARSANFICYIIDKYTKTIFHSMHNCSYFESIRNKPLKWRVPWLPKQNYPYIRVTGSTHQKESFLMRWSWVGRWEKESHSIGYKGQWLWCTYSCRLKWTPKNKTTGKKDIVS